MTNKPFEGYGNVPDLVAIQAALETQQECRAVHRGIAEVREEYEGEAVWHGDVYVFDLIDHPTAEVAYAWSDPVPGTIRRRFYTVLHTGPVDSPEKAVRAAIVSEYRQAKGET